MTPDDVAFASTRNTVSSMITGQAAGTAASIAVKKKIAPREVNIKQLQQALLQHGVFLKAKPDPIEK
jgi:Holliday junction resolvasome RuvABC endonuclease subunit